MTFEFTRCNDLSLADFARLRREGYPVGRSAHAGNLYPANLAVAQTGAADVIMYDRVTGRKDRVSHPSMVVKNGIQERIACPERMAVRGRVETTSRFEPGRVRYGEFVAKCHSNAMQDAFPEATVMTHTEYLAEHAELVWKILEEVGKIDPHRFYRRIDGDGNLDRKLSRGQSVPWDALCKDIFGFTNPNAGWLQDNVLNVLVYAIVEAHRTGSSVVYHTSGVDMDGYIDGMLPDLTALYDHLCNRGVVERQRLEFSLAVITPMRFCGDPQDADAFTRLFEAVKRYRHFESGVGTRIKAAAPEAKQDVITVVSEDRFRHKGEINEIMAAVPGFMYSPDQADFFSQYDTLDKGLFVLEEAVATPLSELSAMVQTVTRLTPRNR